MKPVGRECTEQIDLLEGCTQRFQRLLPENDTMTSFDFDETLAEKVATALRAGRAEQPEMELAFVLYELNRSTWSVEKVEVFLDELADGVSPYHVFGEFPIPGTQATIAVPRCVMPPGSVTPDMIRVIQEIVNRYRPSRIVDMGCGTGVLGIAANLVWTGSTGLLIDIDQAAASCSCDNVRRLGLADRVIVVQSDGLGCVRPQTADMLIANLPFVPDAEMATLTRRFAVHAPAGAVRGGVDGPVSALSHDIIHDASAAGWAGKWPDPTTAWR